MTFRREKNLQESVRKAIVKRYGKNVYYIHPRSMVQKDLLDTYLCYFGQFVSIECKKDLSIKGATKRQLYTLKQIKEAGGYCIVADNVHDVITALEIIRPVFETPNIGRIVICQNQM